ncbi:MAG: ATP-grasp domain-containing protein, partial [Mariprofundaceae bacterium]|nr:ATP-grasp domain-containing protein [Mariprofundaceae bacterium]
GGRAMQIVHDEAGLLRYMAEAVQASPDHPVLLDRFLNQAIELDVDALCDGQRVVIGGIMEHIEEAGVHSGDSACCLPPHSISDSVIAEVTRQTKALGMALQVRGLMNIQFALQGETLYVLEVNPRASRTVPFVSKATGVPLAKVAARIMAGKSLDELGIDEVKQPTTYRAVKEAVVPFVKFRGVDPLLSPEMKSTGEVMGIAVEFPAAFAKAQLGAGSPLPDSGRAFVSVRDADKDRVVDLSKMLVAAGFEVMTTEGTSKILAEADVPCTKVAKVIDGVRPHIVDKLLSNEINFIVNTTEGERTIADSKSIRQAALDRGIVYFTTMAGGLAAAESMLSNDDVTQVRSIQEYLKGEV